MRNGLLLGVGNTNNITTAITMSYGEPNWAIIPSAGRCKKTKEQLVFEIKDLANRVANAKEGIEKEQLNREVLKLHADYLSDVSPDRIGLYQQAEKVIKSQNKDNKGIPHGIGELTLLYFLKHADKSQNLADKSFPLAGGATVTCPILTTGGYGVVIEQGGVQILSGSDYGWGYQMTPAELQKNNEFYAIYNSTVRNAQKEAKEELRDLPEYLEDRPMFNSFA